MLMMVLMMMVLMMMVLMMLMMMVLMMLMMLMCPLYVPFHCWYTHLLKCHWNLLHWTVAVFLAKQTRQVENNLN